MLARRPILAYLLISYGLTWVLALPLVLDNRGVTQFGVPHWWEGIAAFGPFVAAWWLGAGHRPAVFWQQFRRWPAGFWGWVTCLTPVAFLVVAAVAVTATRGAPDPAVFARGELGSAAGWLDLIIVAAILQSVGEEPGWRGFLLPKLRERFAPFAATLVLFPLWLFWHLPFFLGRPEFGLGQFAGFSLGILSAAFWMTWLWERTHSSLVAIVWHALLNITRGIALGFSVPMFLSYGMAVTVGAVAIAVLLWRAGRRTA